MIGCRGKHTVPTKTYAKNWIKLLHKSVHYIGLLLLRCLIAIPKCYQEKILKRIDIDALTDQMIISLYDKHFTLSEVKDLLIFYRSATGQKILKTTPLLMEEMLRDMTEKLIPQVMKSPKNSKLI